MSIVKSISVGNGDMFYIQHNTDNFSIIDCCMTERVRDTIISEIKSAYAGKGVVRFISTHPDNDHIMGLDYLDSKMPIGNFYCVNNKATKPDLTLDFLKYCELRDSEKAFYVFQGCRRKWMNTSDEIRGSAGIEILWPNTGNSFFIDELDKAAKQISYNNISPIIKYSVQDGVSILWMGDLETDFMKNIEDDLSLDEVDILFAPHHGRSSGKVPSSWLRTINPKIVIIGEAPSNQINYYSCYNTITQNSAGDITLECIGNKVHIYVSNKNYSVDFLDFEGMNTFNYYLGTLNK